MVWLSPKQNEIALLQSQQKMSQDDNNFVLRQLEVRPGWGGRDTRVSIICLSVRKPVSWFSGGVRRLPCDSLLA